MQLYFNPKSRLYLGDRFPAAKLAPPIDSPDRGRYLSLMVYSAYVDRLSSRPKSMRMS